MNQKEFVVLREIVLFPDHPSSIPCNQDNPCHLCNQAQRRISIAAVWDGIRKEEAKIKEYNKIRNGNGNWRESDWGIDFGDELSPEYSLFLWNKYISKWKDAVEQIYNDYPNLLSSNEPQKQNNYVKNTHSSENHYQYRNGIKIFTDKPPVMFVPEINDYVENNIKLLSKRFVIYEDPSTFSNIDKRRRQISLAIVCTNYHKDYLRRVNSGSISSQYIHSYCDGQHKNPKLMKFHKYNYNSRWWESPCGMNINNIDIEQYAKNFRTVIQNLQTFITAKHIKQNIITNTGS